IRAPCPDDSIERHATLDRATNPVAAREQVDRQLLPLELVGRTAPAEASRLPACFDDQREVRREWLEEPGVGDVKLDAVADPAAVLVKGGLKRGRTKSHAAQASARKGAREPAAVEEWRADQFERSRGPAALGEVRAFDQTAAGIHACGVGRWHIRRRRDPG